jgi:MSHA biogenesis protein MshK
MDERMSACRWILGGLLGCSVHAAIGAQELSDPTKPPNVLASPQAAAGADALQGNRLQSVLLSRGRKIAVIDGEPVALGGKVGNAILVSISPSEVVLKEGNEARVVKLYPGTEKKPSAKRSARATSAGGAKP